MQARVSCHGRVDRCRCQGSFRPYGEAMMPRWYEARLNCAHTATMEQLLPCIYVQHFAVLLEVRHICLHLIQPSASSTPKDSNDLYATLTSSHPTTLMEHVSDFEDQNPDESVLQPACTCSVRHMNLFISIRSKSWGRDPESRNIRCHQPLLY